MAGDGGCATKDQGNESQIVVFPSTDGSVKHRKRQRLDPTENDLTSEDLICIISRKDRKPLPFNFFNKCIGKWKILDCIDQLTHERNKKGTIIKAAI